MEAGGGSSDDGRMESEDRKYLVSGRGEKLTARRVTAPESRQFLDYIDQNDHAIRQKEQKCS